MHWKCSEKPLELDFNCSRIALELSWESVRHFKFQVDSTHFETALELLQNGSETVLEISQMSKILSQF